MLYTYDPVLVIFSIIIAILGAYTCFDLVIRIRIRIHEQNANRKLLVGAAFAIGGSIWAMHFVAMLAVQLPIVIRYDLLLTLISGFVSVLMTAVALIIVATASYSLRRIIVAGFIMGIGISSMHYVGMSAIRGNCGLAYSTGWVLISLAIGIAASSGALWSAMKLHGIWRRLVAALVMGVSISGMHYTAMAGTAFFSVNNAIEFSQPILSPFSLGIVTAVATFFILGCSLITLVPASRFADPELEEEAGEPPTDTPGPVDVDPKESIPHPDINKLPILKNQKTYFIDCETIISVSANGHYTSVRTTDSESLFCNFSLARVEQQLDPQSFFRVHRSHIINLNYVESFKREHDKGLVFMQDEGHQIPVSRTNLAGLQTALGI